MKTIPLTKGQYAIVDDRDYKWLNQFCWQAKKQICKHQVLWSVCRQAPRKEGKPRTRYMSREIMQARSGTLIDHKNCDGLDNRRDNLRVATNTQSVQNRRKWAGTTSRFKGVTWHKLKHKWVAQIRINGRLHRLGDFIVEKNAAERYDRWAESNFGQFALTNKTLGLLTLHSSIK